MKKLKLFTLTIIAVVITFVACEKSTNEYLTTVDNAKSIFHTSKRVVTDQQIDEVALLHNKYLLEGLRKYDYSTNNHIVEMRNQFKVIGTNDLNLNTTEINDLLSNSDSYDFVCKNSADADVKLVMDNVKNYIIQNPNSTFSDIQIFVSTQEVYARAQITGVDLDLSLVF